MMIEVNYVHFHNLNRNVLDLGKQVRELAEENARLKEEVRELKFERVHDLNHIGDLQEENARLKAEVERLTAFTTRTIIPNEELQAQVEELQNRCDFLEGRQS